MTIDLASRIPAVALGTAWLAALALGCGDPSRPADAGGDADAGAEPADAGPDSGSVVTDGGGLPVDAGIGRDSGSTDAGDALPDRLSVSGAQVITPDGAPIVLRGYNWGHWGTVVAGDGADNAGQGANSVRIPLRWWGEWRDGVDAYDPTSPETAYIDAAHLAILDEAIAEAAAAELWIVLFVDSNCGQASPGEAEACGNRNFWNEPLMRERFRGVWRFVMERYRDQPWIGLYELLPEPRYSSPDEVRTFYEELVLELRPVEPRTPFVVGPTDGYDSSLLESAYTDVDDGLVYTANYFIFSHPGIRHVDELTAFSAAHDVPVWVNQLGVESGRDMARENAIRALEALAGADIGWAWWSYRIHTTNPDNHGIYYLAADETTWIRKDDWYALVGEYL